MPKLNLDIEGQLNNKIPTKIEAKKLRVRQKPQIIKETLIENNDMPINLILNNSFGS